MVRCGSELAGMLPTHADWWMRLCEDMMRSSAVRRLENSFIRALTVSRELRHCQLDATVKVMMHVKGQGSSRMPKKARESQALPENESVYRIACLRGTTGAVRIVKPIRGEAAIDIASCLQSELSQDELDIIETLSVDCVSDAIEVEMLRLCRGFKALILDYKHLEFRYRSAHWGNSSPGSKLLGMILSRFNAHSYNRGPRPDYFTRGSKSRVQAREVVYRQMIRDCSMPVREATDCIECMDFSSPFRTRSDFVKAIAALVALFPDETNKTCPPGPLTIRGVLYNCCEVASVEYKLNHTRLVHKVSDRVRGFIAACTCSVEALHRELNKDVFHNVSNTFQGTIFLKAQIFRLIKLWAYDKMMHATKNKAYPQGQVISRSVSIYEAWSDLEWTSRCLAPLDLPLWAMKQRHRYLIRKRTGSSTNDNTNGKVIMRPGRRRNLVLQRVRKRRKNTPFSLPRREALVQTRGLRVSLNLHAL